jgi:predicted nucleic acid-binding protein
MRLYMLSTDIATCLIRGKSKVLDTRVAAVPPGQLCISAVTRGELLFGVSRQLHQTTAVAEPTKPRTPGVDQRTIEALRKTTHSVLAALTPAEAKALRARFGIIDQGAGHTLESVGKQFDVTRERIRSSEQEDDLSSVVDQFLTRVSCLPWDAAAATHFATVAFELHNVGTPMGTADTMIAGHAIAVGAVLATGGGQRFSSVPGLKTENWMRRRATQ